MPAQLGRRAGVPAARACAARVLLASAVALGASRAREAPLKLSELASGYVQEDDFEHYAVRIPPSSRAVKVIITPIFGDPVRALRPHERRRQRVTPRDAARAWGAGRLPLLRPRRAG